jgi:hypothetical protein
LSVIAAPVHFHSRQIKSKNGAFRTVECRFLVSHGIFLSFVHGTVLF